MRFLADENIWKSLVVVLAERGHDMLRVGDICAGGTDEAVLDAAHDTGRVLLTEDKDFGHLVFGRGQNAPGVVLIQFNKFRSEPTVTVQAVADAIEIQGTAMSGAVTVIEPTRVRRKQL